MYNIEVEVNSKDKGDFYFNISNFPFIPRKKEVIWCDNVDERAILRDKYDTTAFIVNRVYYHFHDMNELSKGTILLTVKPLN